MKLKLLAILLAGMATLTVRALSVEETAAITKTLQTTRRPELPFVASRIVKAAKPADRKQVQDLVIKTVRSHRPAALVAVQAAVDTVLPAENRPPTTPGNENGRRPTVPPGLDKNDYGRP